ncbi:gamma-tubulin complex component 3 homolog [Liolophura sinensis]|uniref:gamma-tubulin complex component 3 homolog n=1 Tax=Liolophura sinensis TaxID=3198878 RepID=UPI0031591D5A
MADRPLHQINAATILTHRLCCKITGLDEDAVLPLYMKAVRVFGSNVSCPFEADEFVIAQKITRLLVRQGKDVASFNQLHRKLQSQALKRRWAMLYLLLSLSEHDTRSKVQFENSLFARNLPGYSTSTPYHVPGRPQPAHTPGAGSFQSVSHSTGSSGISSIHSQYSSNDPTPVHLSLIPSLAFTPAQVAQGNFSQVSRVTQEHRAPSVRQANWTGTTEERLATIGSDTDMVPQSWRSAPTTHPTFTVRGLDNTSFELPESELVDGLLMVFQGIETKWVRFDNAKDSYKVNSDSGIPKSVRQLVSKMAELGWLYNKSQKYLNARSSDKAFGRVGKSFCEALKQELTEYYRLIAVVKAQVDQDASIKGLPNCDKMTLRRLAVWTFDPLIRLKALAALVDICKGKKGGALCSAIYSYMQHGDPQMRILVKHMLTIVAQPVYVTLIRWSYDGELDDQYHEFFVASDPTVKQERLWFEKYSLRKSMIPTFMSTDQARRILLTGKSINFLKEVCHDRTAIVGREDAMNMDMEEGAKSMFSQDTNSAFQLMIDTVYKETSQHLLDVFHNKYKFLDHLKAMRRYLLLGQGDFIRHLMDLLEEDLAKPAGNLYLHNLTGILETAIRATNAQFDDTDILKRLDVRLLEVSPGDTGWDVFSLYYHVDGPIRTVITPECIIMYLRVFNFLWRAKRMEYILAMVWKSQMFMDRLIAQIPELLGVNHQCHVLTCEMVHFIQQVQYYINFEVLECLWDELLTKVKEAKDLDYIIAAHEVFLDAINVRCLLDKDSMGILTQLRAIFDLIIQFQTAQGAFYSAVEEEIDTRQRFSQQMQKKTDEGKWGVTEAEQTAEDERRSSFLRSLIQSTRLQLQVLATSYRDKVQEFIMMVTTHQDTSLRFLIFRLDFNEHYKARDPKLRSPLVYQRHKQRV